MAGSGQRASRRPVWVAAVVGLVIALGVLFYFWLPTPKDLGEWGSRGDAVAPITALVSAGALFAAIYSVSMQRKELELQREEMAAQRAEMELQREELRETRKVQEQQVSAQHSLAEQQRLGNELLARSNDLTGSLIAAQNASNDLAQQLFYIEERNLKVQEQANKFQAYLIEAQRESQRATLRSAWATLVTKYYELNRPGDDRTELGRNIKMVEAEIDAMAFAPNPYTGRGRSDRLPPKHPGAFHAPGEREKLKEQRRRDEGPMDDEDK